MNARRGVALATALFALVAIAALVHSIVAPAVAAQRAATTMALHHRLESAAERELADVAGGWGRSRWLALAVGESEVVTSGQGDAPRIVRTSTRHAPDVWQVAVEATAAGGDSRVVARRSVLLELRADSVPLLPGVMAGGPIELGASAVVASDPVCPGGPAIVAAPGSRVDVPDELASGVVRDGGASDPARYTSPGGFALGTLDADAVIVLAAGAVVSPRPEALGSTCLEGSANWGDPAGPGAGACGSRRPVIRALGDLHVAGGAGQGILHVAGTLRIAGPFRFRGLIVAENGILAGGENVQVAGALLGGATAGIQMWAAPTSIAASGCAVGDAIAATGVPRILRSWGRVR